MGERAGWTESGGQVSDRADWEYEDEAWVSGFQGLVYQLRTEAGSPSTQAELAEQMGTTQSAMARMEGGGARATR